MSGDFSAQRPSGHESSADGPLDLAALYVAGAMTHDERKDFEARLRDNGAERDALLSFNAVGETLIDQIEPVQPDPAIRAALLERVTRQAAAAEDHVGAPAPLIRRATDAWRPAGVPGVSMRILHIDRRQKRLTALFRMEPGASFPSHVHDQPEECLMLEGDLDFGDYVLHAGDYLRLEAGTTHSTARTKRGCVCLVIAELPESLAA